MAKVTLNQNLKAMWGRIDNLVFRRSPSGRTVLSKAPDMSRVKWSDAQRAHRQRFKQAVAYAKAAMADERLRARYEQASVIQGKRPFRLRRGGLRLLQGTGFEEHVGARHRTRRVSPCPGDSRAQYHCCPRYIGCGDHAPADTKSILPMPKFDPQIHHRRSIRLKGYDYAQAGAYFVTIVTWHRECLFGEVTNEEMQINRYGEIVQKWWNNIPMHFPNVETGAFVIMPNHVHGIIFIVERRGTVPVPQNGIDIIPMPGNGINIPLMPDIGTNINPLPKGDISNNTQGGGTPPLPTLGQIVAYFKYQSTKEMNLLDNTGTVTKFWQRNYYEHVIRNDKDLRNKTDYILANPLLWAQDNENPVHGNNR